MSDQLSLVQEPDQDFSAIVAKGDKTFLQRLQLAQPGSDCFLKQQPACRPGEYVLGHKDKSKNLGSSPTLVIGHKRYHAIVLQDRKVEAESFDLNDPVFKQIEEEALSRKKKPGRAVKFGIDFLLYVPSLNEFGVFFFAATAKREAPEALKRQGQLAVFKSELVESNGNKWYVPKVSDGEGPLPSIDGKLLQTTLQAFTTDRLATEPEEEETSRPR